MKVAVGFERLLNCVVFALGPLNTDQEPVPTEGELPANVADPVEQIVCPEVLVAVVGSAFTVIVASAAEIIQGELLIVHLTT